MIVKAVRTDKILPGGLSIFEVLDKAVTKLEEGSVVAITSKIVSICEGSLVPENTIDKQKLIQREADYYLPARSSKYPDVNFTIKDNTLIPAAGIDQSNTGGFYVLWPKDVQATANAIRNHLQTRLKIRRLGILITDSFCPPLRWGTIGTALAYSGFKAVNNLIGKPDLFGRSFNYSQAGVASGLAASAVLIMGEGTEQTPVVVISDVPFIVFQARDPTHRELGSFKISKLEDDLFAPFFKNVKWLPGTGKGK